MDRVENENTILNDLLSFKYWSSPITFSIFYSGAFHFLQNKVVMQQILTTHPYIKLTGLLNRKNFYYVSWITKRDGISALWRGGVSGMIAFQRNAVEFKIKEKIFKEIFEKKPIHEREFKDFIKFFLVDFSISGILSVLFQPSVVVSYTRISEIDPILRHSGSIECLIQILEDEGIRGLYKGLKLRLLKDLCESLLSSIGYLNGVKLSIIDSNVVGLGGSLWMIKNICLYWIDVFYTRATVGFNLFGDFNVGNHDDLWGIKSGLLYRNILMIVYYIIIEG